jgi:hypothetical protein
MAEHFRDEGRDVLLFIDNIYRYTLAGVEVSALLGRMPSAVGYQPTLAAEMGELQERITSTKTGSITSIQAVYVPADDLTDPSPATTFGHLDSTIVLSRDIASLGIYPAVDPLDSTSRQLDPHVVGEEHYTTARRVQQTLQRYKELRDIIAIWGMDFARGRGLASAKIQRLSQRSTSPRTSPARGVRAVATHPRFRDRRRRVRSAPRAGIQIGASKPGKARRCIAAAPAMATPPPTPPCPSVDLLGRRVGSCFRRDGRLGSTRSTRR